jgi:3-dehydroquinate dehydratase-2
MTNVLVLNGPNLGRLGSREPEIYGDQDLASLETLLVGAAPAGLSVELRQSDSEAELIGWLHEAVDTASPVILNAGALTHYSYSLRDAVSLVTSAGGTVIDVHISNPHAREEFRHTSVISAVSSGVIAGFGFDSYVLALTAIGRR